MIVLSHRGYWKDVFEKNQTTAFERSFNDGFGTETDVRDRNGNLVISHDVPTESAILLSELVRIHRGRGLPLALNIKADGLAVGIAEQMRGVDPKLWFVFDMSVPDARDHLKVGNPVFSRMSEVESASGWLSEVDGIWLDAFVNDYWYETALIEDILKSGKRVCVVSPDLHGRAHAEVWKRLFPLRGLEGLMICTDFPEEARIFFASSKEQKLLKDKHD